MKIRYLDYIPFLSTINALFRVIDLISSPFTDKIHRIARERLYNQQDPSAIGRALRATVTAIPGINLFTIPFDLFRSLRTPTSTVPSPQPAHTPTTPPSLPGEVTYIKGTLNCCTPTLAVRQFLNKQPANNASLNSDQIDALSQARTRLSLQEIRNINLQSVDQLQDIPPFLYGSPARILIVGKKDPSQTIACYLNGYVHEFFDPYATPSQVIRCDTLKASIEYLQRRFNGDDLTVRWVKIALGNVHSKNRVVKGEYQRERGSLIDGVTHLHHRGDLAVAFDASVLYITKKALFLISPGCADVLAREYKEFVSSLPDYAKEEDVRRALEQRFPFPITSQELPLSSAVNLSWNNYPGTPPPAFFLGELLEENTIDADLHKRLFRYFIENLSSKYLLRTYSSREVGSNYFSIADHDYIRINNMGMPSPMRPVALVRKEHLILFDPECCSPLQEGYQVFVKGLPESASSEDIIARLEQHLPPANVQTLPLSRSIYLGNWDGPARFAFSFSQLMEANIIDPDLREILYSYYLNRLANENRLTSHPILSSITPVQQAVFKGKREDLDTIDPNEALLFSLSVKNMTAIHYCIEKIDPTFCDAEGHTFLHHACRNGLTTPELLDLLMQRGVKPCQVNHRGETALDLYLDTPFGQNEGVVIVDLVRRMKPDWCDEEENNLLHRALLWRRTNSFIYEILIEAGVDLRKTNHAGQTPSDLYRSLSDNRCSTIADLLNPSIAAITPARQAVFKGTLDALNTVDPNEALFIALELRNMAAIRHCIGRINPVFCDKEGNTFLHHACRSGFVTPELLDLLMQQGVNPCQVNRQGDTALDLYLDIPLGHNEERVIRNLVKRINPNREETALDLNILHGPAKSVILDLVKRMKPGWCDENGNNLYHRARLKGRTDSSIYETLTEAGVDPEGTNHAGQTPLALEKALLKQSVAALLSSF